MHRGMRGGRLKKLTVAGCIASFESWECLSLYWSSALTAMKLPYFHMADFEARRPPYNDWTEDERKNRLDTLLTIIGGPDRHCYSFTNIARPDDTTSSIYKRCANDVLLELSLLGEEFAVVFAHHPEFGRHTELLDLMLKYGIGGTIRSCSVALPTDTCPLQAADLVAYEMNKEERDILIPRRYPLLRLHRLRSTFRFGSATRQL
jgi:hypothetical protein